MTKRVIQLSPFLSFLLSNEKQQNDKQQKSQTSKCLAYQITRLIKIVRFKLFANGGDEET